MANSSEHLAALLNEADPKDAANQFKDLIEGNIDIIEYLNSSNTDTPVDSPIPAERSNVSAVQLKQALMLHANGNSAPRQANVTSSTNGQNRRTTQQQPPIYGTHPPRLPESPPETDSSGAGSAGSPSSGSENSPYSPDFTGYAAVIQPPIGSHHHNVDGVILGVQDLTPNMLVHNLLDPQLQQHHLGPRAVVHHNVTANGNANALTSPQQASDFGRSFPPSQPTSGAMPQVSPPSRANARVPQTCPPSPYILPPPQGISMELYGGEQPRKRPRTDSNSFVKPEPTSPTGGEDYELDGYPHQQCIRFSNFQEENGHTLYDAHARELTQLEVHVVADKGFNYSHFDGCFVNQKKNHFQISVHIEAKDDLPPHFVKVDNQLKEIAEFRLAFYGVKAEMPSSTIMIKQSQTDRKPVPHEPVQLSITQRRVTKVTVPRLHFSETTMNNQRKNGRPNPDQKYILLVVSLTAVLTDKQSVIVSSHASEKVIVRASNPGQFDNGESDVQWQKSANGSSIFHPGPVSIGTDKAQGMLTVAGDISCAGSVFHPSDRRLKENISEIDYASALSRLSQVRIVEYSIRPEVAEEWGISEEERHKVGVIAQELADVLPDAVREDGEFLTVDDNRIFYDTVAAAKELSKLTGNLECKLHEVEKISKKLARLKKLGSFKSSTLSGLSATSEMSSGICTSVGGSYISCSRSSLGSISPSLQRKDKKDKDRSDIRYSSGRKTNYRQGYHKHCACHRLDQGLCSSKVIQCTAVILVVVMAFCLVAMATIYILDWQKRNSIVVLPLPSTTEIPALEATTMVKENKVGNIYESRKWKPPEQSNVPPIAPCNQKHCQMYCCGDQLTYKGNGNRHKNDDISVIGLPSDKHLIRPARSYSFNSNARPLLKGEHMTTHGLSGVRIDIPEFNTTLDERWCAEYGCKAKEGRFDLYIPISTYMPTIPLEINFDAGNKRHVDSCGKKQDFDIFCRWAQDSGKRNVINYPKVSEVKRKAGDIFEIPVGNFIKTAYVFRVGFTTESCSMSSDQMGLSFDEYTLYFYRQCSNQEVYNLHAAKSNVQS